MSALSLTLGCARTSTTALDGSASRGAPNDSAAAENPSVFDARVATPPAQALLAAGGRETYRGTVDDKLAVVMRLQRIGDAVVGSYFYEGRGLDIALHGQIAPDGTLTLQESSQGKTTGTIIGHCGLFHRRGRPPIQSVQPGAARHPSRIQRRRARSVARALSTRRGE